MSRFDKKPFGEKKFKDYLMSKVKGFDGNEKAVETLSSEFRKGDKNHMYRTWLEAVFHQSCQEYLAF